MQVLQVYSPMGHALGLSVISSSMEDSSLSILFAESYPALQEWVASSRTAWLAALSEMRAQLQEAMESDEKLRRLKVDATVSVRAKSAFSMMKKLLELQGAPPLPDFPLRDPSPCAHGLSIRRCSLAA